MVNDRSDGALVCGKVFRQLQFTDYFEVSALRALIRQCPLVELFKGGLTLPWMRKAKSQSLQVPESTARITVQDCSLAFVAGFLLSAGENNEEVNEICLQRVDRPGRNISCSARYVAASHELFRPFSYDALGRKNAFCICSSSFPASRLNLV